MSKRNQDRNRNRLPGNVIEITNVPLSFKRQPVFLPRGKQTVMLCAVMPDIDPNRIYGVGSRERAERLAREISGKYVLPRTRRWDVNSRPQFNCAVRIYLRKGGGIALYLKADVMDRDRRTYSEAEYANGARRAQALVGDHAFKPERDDQGRTQLVSYDDTFYGQKLVLRLDAGQAVEPGKPVRVFLVEEDFHSVALLIGSAEEEQKIVLSSASEELALTDNEQEPTEAFLKTPTPVITARQGHRGAVTDKSQLVIGFNYETSTAAILDLPVEDWADAAINKAVRKKLPKMSSDRAQSVFANNPQALALFEETQKSLQNAGIRAKQYLKRLAEEAENERAMEAEVEAVQQARRDGTYEGKDHGVITSTDELAAVLREAVNDGVLVDAAAKLADVSAEDFVEMPESRQAPFLARAKRVLEQKQPASAAQVRGFVAERSGNTDDSELEAEAAQLAGMSLERFLSQSRKIRRSWITKAQNARSAGSASAQSQA